MLFKGWALSSLFCTFCLCSDIYFWLLPQPLCWWLEDFSFVKFTTLMFSSTDESLKDETHLLLLWVDSLVTPGFSLLGGCGGHPPWPAENLFTPPPPTPGKLSLPILILIGVQYSQNAAFSFEKGSNCQNHFSSGSHHLVKNPPSAKFLISPPTGGEKPWTLYLSIYLSIYLSVYLSLFLPIHPSIHLSIYRSSRKNTTLIFHLIVTAVA